MIRAKQARALLLLLLVLIGGGSACQPAVSVDAITIRLNGPHSAEWAGFYVAQSQGYYAAENLEVTLLVDGGEPLQEMLNGTTDFALASSMDVLLAYADDNPVMAVAAIMRRSPLAVMALAENDIAQPRDLRSKRVGIVSSERDAHQDLQFLTMLSRVGVALDRVELVALGQRGVMPLVDRRVDAIAYASATQEAVVARAAGYEFDLAFFSDYAVLEYPNLIVTSETMVWQRPDLVARFVRATLAGYRYALLHPEEAAASSLLYDEGLDVALQREIFQAAVPFIDTGDRLLGTMESGVWQSTHDVLQGRGVIAEPLMLDDVYTNQFITYPSGDYGR